MLIKWLKVKTLLTIVLLELRKLIDFLALLVLLSIQIHIDYFQTDKGIKNITRVGILLCNTFFCDGNYFWYIVFYLWHNNSILARAPFGKYERKGGGGEGLE